MPQDRYQTVQEVADRLEVAEATVRQWIKAGALRAIDIGKGWRIADTDLAQFLTARETAPRLGATEASATLASPAESQALALLPRLGPPEAGFSQLFHDDGLAAPSG